MSKLSLGDKIGVLFEVSKSSYLYLVIVVLLLVLGFIILSTNKRNKKRNKIIYISSSIFIFAFIIISYHSSLGNIFDYMMNNFFIAVYFPNLAIYLAAIIATNIIVWISIFNFRTSEIIKRLNVTVYIIMNYLLALILNVVNASQLDVFEQSSVYGNKKATALIELSSYIFTLWIIFLIIYKIILVYIKKDYKPKVKKVVVKKKVKKLPENYEPKEMPDYIYGNLTKNEPIPEIINSKEDSKVKAYEELLTLEDYKLLLKILKEQKEKDRMEKLRQEAMKKEYDKFEQLQAIYRSIK